MFVTWSELNQPVCCVCVSGPSAVSGLAVTSRTCSSLGLSWQAGPGRTQRFRLQLWERPQSPAQSGTSASNKKNMTQQVLSEFVIIKGCRDLSLLLYQVHESFMNQTYFWSQSGWSGRYIEYKSPTEAPFSGFRCSCTFKLKFCPIDVLFTLLLPLSAGLLKNETLESTTTQHTLLNLTPGRLYNVTVVTEAGDLQNSRTIEAQTGRDIEQQREGGKMERSFIPESLSVFL